MKKDLSIQTKYYKWQWNTNSVSDDKILIRRIVEYCKFMLLKEESLEQCSLKEFITDQE